MVRPNYTGGVVGTHTCVLPGGVVGSGTSVNYTWGVVGQWYVPLPTTWGCRTVVRVSYLGV